MPVYHKSLSPHMQPINYIWLLNEPSIKLESIIKKKSGGIYECERNMCNNLMNLFYRACLLIDSFATKLPPTEITVIVSKFSNR